MKNSLKGFLWFTVALWVIYVLWSLATGKDVPENLQLYAIIAASALAIIYTIEGYKLNTTVTIKYKNEDKEPEVRDV